MGVLTDGKRWLLRCPRSLAGNLDFAPKQPFSYVFDLYGMVVHVIRCNTHYAIDNRR